MAASYLSPPSLPTTAPALTCCCCCSLSFSPFFSNCVKLAKRSEHLGSKLVGDAELCRPVLLVHRFQAALLPLGAQGADVLGTL